MSKTSFLFICVFFVLLHLFGLGELMNSEQQFIVSFALILLLGIPHGAIDHVLFLQKSEISVVRFIAVYLLLTGLNVAFWLLLPTGAYLVFLLISAYHFGQSQFSHYLSKAKYLDGLLYLGWGALMLSALISFNADELLRLASVSDDLSAFTAVNQSEIVNYVLYGSAAVTGLILGFKAMQKEISIANLVMELLISGILLVSFWLFPFLISFTLYFIILHSLKVMKEEYDFLKNIELIYSIKQFIWMLTPLSVLSFLGIGLLYVGIHFEIIQISYGLIFMIVISSITLPHVLVMERFYGQVKNQ